jgi:prepilin-type processing-associated H-X9-DG protein
MDKFVKSGDYQIACPTYSGISGAANYDGFNETRVSKCCRSDGQISAGGVLIPNAEVRARQITDGLAKTMIVGEQSDFAYTSTGEPVQIAGSFMMGWLTGTRATGIPPNYGSWLQPSFNLATIRYPLNEHRFDLPGLYEDIGANNPLLSAHSGIVNVLYCDGSVQSLEDSIDLLILKSFATRDDGGPAVPIE